MTRNSVDLTLPYPFGPDVFSFLSIDRIGPGKSFQKDASLKQIPMNFKKPRTSTKKHGLFQLHTRLKHTTNITFPQNTKHSLLNLYCWKKGRQFEIREFCKKDTEKKDVKLLEVLFLLSNFLLLIFKVSRFWNPTFFFAVW